MVSPWQLWLVTAIVAALVTWLLIRYVVPFE
jgi:hypothetical protein